MGNYEVIGDHVLISYFVKYDVLAQLINNEFKNSDAEEVNIFIDAYSMIKSIYNLDPSQFIDQYSIASCIINACAHYRNFFWTRYKVTTKIWIVFSRMEQSVYEAKHFYPNYGNVFTSANNPLMDEMIDKNMEILNTLCPYIPDVQFIHSIFESGLVFGKIANSQYGANTPSFIITKDPWNLQTVANANMTYMIRPIKKNGIDQSVLISNKTVVNFVAGKYITDNIIGSEYLSFIFASTRFPERNMKSLHNMSYIIKALTTAIKNNKIPSGKMIYDIDGLCAELNLITKNLKSYEIGLRVNAIGFYPCMYRYINHAMSDNINIINLHDPDSVKRINETYFSKVPLDLMSL